MNTSAKTQPVNNHRPSDDLLAAYAAGSLLEAPSILVASHLTLAPKSRAIVASYEAAGGAMLDAAQPVGLKVGALSAILRQLDSGHSQMSNEDLVCCPTQEKKTPKGLTILPKPIRDYLGEADVNELPWRRMAPGIHQVRITAKGGDARLLRIEGGRSVPEHGHNGMEWTLVLDGAFSDQFGTFDRGDVEEADGDITHQPAAKNGTDCICLAVTNAPLKLKGFARLLQPLVGI